MQAVLIAGSLALTGVPDFPDVDLSGDLRPAPPAPAEAASVPHTLYLNFSDGTESVTRSPFDRARENLSGIGGASPFPEFQWKSFLGEGSSRPEVVGAIAARVNQAFLPYDIVLTTVRPDLGSYSMVMIGGGPEMFGLPSEVAGVALLDCTNRQEGNVTFAFPANIRGSAHTLFVTIAQEAAHAYGLEHTNNPEDLMFPRASTSQKSFTDVDSPIAGDLACGPPIQNSHRLLRATLGSWPGGDKPVTDGLVADEVPPTVGFDEPGAGALVRGPFRVRVAAHDNVALSHVILEAGGENASLSAPPWEWWVSDFPAGPLTLTVRAHDQAGHSTESTVEVAVDVDDTDGAGCAVAGPEPAHPALLGVALAGLACARRRGRV